MHTRLQEKYRQRTCPTWTTPPSKTLDLSRNLYQLATWRNVQLYFIYFPNTLDLSLNLYKKS
jgi:hypothetical protein